MALDAKIAQLVELVMDLSKKVVQLEDKRTPNTLPEVLAQRRDVATQDVKEIENAKQTCAKVMDQVSHTWETLMDDEQSQKIASDHTMLEENIAWIWNEIKQLPLEQKKVKTTEMCGLQQQTIVLCAQQHQRKEKIEDL